MTCDSGRARHRSLNIGASYGGPGFLSAMLMVLSLQGCERPGKQVSPPASEAPVVSSGEAAVDAATDPAGQAQSAAEEPSEGPDAAIAAEERLPAVEFAEGAGEAFRAAFVELQGWVAKHKGAVFAAVVDLQSDQWLLRHQSSKPVNVASNAKVVTTAAALSLLGPAYQFKTELFCDLNADGTCPRLILRGGGAPDLTTADLYRFVSVLKGRGLQKVEELVVDQSLFDTPYEPPAYGQQPEEWAPFRANISALAVDENSVTLNVATTQAGEPARVWFDPPGVVQATGKVSTGKRGSGDKVSWSLSAKDDPQYLLSTVGGSLAEEAGRRRYSRRLEDPRLAGGLALRSLLSDAGVSVPDKVSLGERRKEERVALWYSEPLAEVVRALGKDSDNFFAEMVFVALSQAATEQPVSKTWSSARGAQVAVDWLKSIGASMDGIVVKNGSGLFDANRYSAELLVQVLAHVEDNPRIYHDFVSQLAMGATDGTMKKRMTGDSAGARVRAKTGTLAHVDALTGYVGRTSGKSPLAFSIVVQDVKASHAEVRNQVDRAVLKWARLSD